MKKQWLDLLAGVVLIITSLVVYAMILLVIVEPELFQRVV